MNPEMSPRGIDFPDVNVDLKVTSIAQPQSSCPFRDAAQKVYGLGYDLLVMVYEKTDDMQTATSNLNIQHVVYVEASRTADFQTTSGIQDILNNSGNVEDIDAFLEDKNFPLDAIGRRDLAEQIVATPPKIGYLTISNALQWRLQYGRTIDAATHKTPPTGVEVLDAE